MEKPDLTFLTEDQIFGDNRLQIFEKYGTRAAPTDFAILSGCYFSPYRFTKDGNTLKNRSCNWWTKTYEVRDGVVIVNDYGRCVKSNAYYRAIGARPAISYSSIKPNNSLELPDIRRIKEIQYGEYPQMVVDESFSLELEEEYKNGTLEITGKNYTTDSIYYIDYYIEFIAKTYPEYKYNGDKYIRFVGDSNCVDRTISDGRTIILGAPYWVHVEPIVWLVDEAANVALSKKILFSGIQFESKKECNIDFVQTNIKRFMDKYFSKDIGFEEAKIVLIDIFEGNVFEEILETELNPIIDNKKLVLRK